MSCDPANLAEGDACRGRVVVSGGIVVAVRGNTADIAVTVTDWDTIAEQMDGQLTSTESAVVRHGESEMEVDRGQFPHVLY